MNSSTTKYAVRIKVLRYLMLFIICTYAIYLFFLQVFQGYLYSEHAERSQQRIETVEARRGAIFDINNVVIADNEYTYSLYLVLGSLSSAEIESITERLAAFIALPIGELERRIASAKAQQAYQIEISDSLSIQEISYIAEHAHLFPSVHWKISALRSYPFQEELAHITGYVGEISEKELRVLYNQGYRQHDVVGKTGLEFQYDRFLRGKEGTRALHVDAFGNQIKTKEIDDPVPGHDIVTSIDTRIQQLAWDALGRRVGSVVVMRPHNGEILAMVSYPSYDPNQFYTSDSREVLSGLLRHQHSPLINRAIQTTYPPASTFKVLMATTIVNENIYGIHNTIFCNGVYELGNSVLREWGGNRFGHLDLFGGLANSSNVYFWTLGVEYVGIERIVDYSHKFGFGRKTEIDLPNEASGLVPDPEWKRIKFNQRWTAGDTANIAIGQGFMNTTPLQIANMIATISNAGTVYKPHLLREVRDSETGEVIESYTPEILFDLQFDRQTFETVERAMQGVIENGTGQSVITTPLVKVAGKTGTSEVQKGVERFHSWFASYAPIDAPPELQVIVVVFVDAVNEWEWWAPKAANIILHGIFSNTDYHNTIAELRNSPRGLWYL